MSVGTKQFVPPPDSKSSFLHGGRIASVIRELQGNVHSKDGLLPSGKESSPDIGELRYKNSKACLLKGGMIALVI